MSGYEVARFACQQQWGKFAYFIALTGWGQAADKERAITAAFGRHLAKPIDADFLSALLDAILDEKRTFTPVATPDL